MAESFLDKGVLSQKGFPSTYAYNNIPAGLAAAAYILTKYNDPLATSVRVQAENSVDYLLTEESNNMKLSRSFNVIRALAWLVKLGNLGDTRLVTKYTPYLQTKMSSLLSNEFSYDGNGWLNGWNHFYATRATWMAYDATGQQEYLNAYNRAMTVYDIDDNGIYRDGVPLEAPGGFETYAGSLPLGAWGHAGRLTDVNTLINLDVPNGWINPEIPVKDLWNDAGAGPWAQDDANPEYVGYSLGGVNIPQEKKYIVPFGSYPIYDVEGNVILSGEPLLDNPFVPDSTSDEVEVLYDGDIDISYKHDEIQLIPGSDLENSHIIQDSGVIVDNQRSLSGTDDSLIYKFDITGYNGAAIDMAISGRSYTVEVSPDGNRWYERLNTWSPWPKWESIDISFLAGNTDELLNLLVVSPPDDTSLIVDQSDTVIEREHCRYIQNNGYFVYRLDLPLIIQCNLELLVANDYVVEFSKDGINWTKELSAKKHRENGHSVAADAGWLRMVDITKYINSNNQVYMRFSDGGNKILYSGKGAFLRKLTAYGIYDTNEVYVKLSNAPYSKKEGFTLQQFKFRKYHTDILPKNAPFNFDDLALLAFDWLEQVVYNENDGQVVIEAENYAEKNIGGDIFWKDVSDDLSMGLGYVKALPDDGLVIDGVNSPQLRYAVNFNSTGNYYLWIKARGENNEATSLHYGIDGQMVSLQSQYMISQVSRDFQWSSQNSDGSQPFIKIESAGQHMIDLWMREDGIQVDRLLLAKDSAYTPVVDEPVESYYNPTIFEANHNKDSIVDLFDLAIMANYWFNM
jgi:hypothetical protein